MRVIAGRFRGRPITAPKGLVTRPTTDRVREALFQILGPLHGQNAIDLYAGTGALGIEALSRGARHATFVEMDRAALLAIKKNIERLGLESETTVIQRAVERSRALLEKNAPYDLVLSDPPWKVSREAAVLVTKALRGLLAPGARVILGRPASVTLELPDSPELEAYDERSWGDSGLSFYVFNG